MAFDREMRAIWPQSASLLRQGCALAAFLTAFGLAWPAEDLPFMVWIGMAHLLGVLNGRKAAPVLVGNRTWRTLGRCLFTSELSVLAVLALGSPVVLGVLRTDPLAPWQIVAILALSVCAPFSGAPLGLAAGVWRRMSRPRLTLWLLGGNIMLGLLLEGVVPRPLSYLTPFVACWDVAVAAEPSALLAIAARLAAGPLLLAVLLTVMLALIPARAERGER